MTTNVTRSTSTVSLHPMVPEGLTATKAVGSLVKGFFQSCAQGCSRLAKGIKDSFVSAVESTAEKSKVGKAVLKCIKTDVPAAATAVQRFVPSKLGRLTLMKTAENVGGYYVGAWAGEASGRAIGLYLGIPYADLVLGRVGHVLGGSAGGYAVALWNGSTQPFASRENFQNSYLYGSLVFEGVGYMFFTPAKLINLSIFRATVYSNLILNAGAVSAFLKNQSNLESNILKATRDFIGDPAAFARSCRLRFPLLAQISEQLIYNIVKDPENLTRVMMRAFNMLMRFSNDPRVKEMIQILAQSFAPEAPPEARGIAKQKLLEALTGKVLEKYSGLRATDSSMSPLKQLGISVGELSNGAAHSLANTIVDTVGGLERDLLQVGTGLTTRARQDFAKELLEVFLDCYIMIVVYKLVYPYTKKGHDHLSSEETREFRNNIMQAFVMPYTREVLPSLLVPVVANLPAAGDALKAVYQEANYSVHALRTGRRVEEEYVHVPERRLKTASNGRKSWAARKADKVVGIAANLISFVGRKISTTTQAAPAPLKPLHAPETAEERASRERLTSVFKPPVKRSFWGQLFWRS